MSKKVKKVSLKEIAEYTDSYVECVGSTLGPDGANVLIQTNNLKIITKDGVTVSEALEYSDPVQQSIVSIMRESARETVSKIGDGTTSTAVLSHRILKLLAVHEDVLRGTGELKVKRVLDRFSDHIEGYIKGTRFGSEVTADTIKNVISISTNSDTSLTNAIYDAVMHVGVGGRLDVRDSGGMETFTEYKEGYEMPSGYYGPTFTNDKKKDMCAYQNPLILITEQTIESAQDLYRIAAFADRAKQPIVIIADDIREEPLAWAAMNASNGKPVAVLRPPSYGSVRVELLQDLAVSIGAKFITKNDSLEKVRLADLGTCDKLHASSKVTVFEGGAGSSEKVLERLGQLKSRIGASEDENEIRRLQDRVARLTASTSVLYVGGLSDSERAERRARVDDAIECVKSIETLGVVPGAGMYYAWLASVALPEITRVVESEMPREYGSTILLVSDVLCVALKYPAEKLISSHFSDYEKLLSTILTTNENKTVEEIEGVNYETGEVGPLIELGVVEPAELSMSVICNSLSVAGILSTVKYIIYEDKE